MPERSSPVPPPRAAQILERRTRALAARGAAAKPGAPPVTVLVCTLGGELYGIPLNAAAQVVPDAPCTALPGAPPALLGLIGQGGQVWILLDLALALGRAAPVAPGGHALLLRASPRPVALRVDRVAGVFSLVPVAAGDGGHAEGAVSGHAPAPPELAAGGRALVGLIDPARLLQPFLASAVLPGA